MKSIHKNIFKATILAFLSISMYNCSDNIEEPNVTKFNFYTAVTAGQDPITEIVVGSENLTNGVISPKNNGIQFSQNTNFFGFNNTLFAVEGYPNTKFTGYSLTNGKLTKKQKSFSIDVHYAQTPVNEKTMLFLASPREGYGAKKIYTVNLETMQVVANGELNFGNKEVNLPDGNTLKLASFPTGMLLKGDKLFIAYLTKDKTDNFTTPFADEAQIAVFDYPSLKFVKTITDKRIANLGRYSSTSTFQEDEKGNIYTFAPSSINAGYAPVPAANSGILKIKNGTTAFDTDFYIDFETVSNGYKIFDLFYIENGKAVVRVLKDQDEKDDKAFYRAYSKPIVKTGIIDLNTKEFTLLNIPAAVGGLTSATLKEGNDFKIALTTLEGIYVYTIDVNAKTATKGAKVEGTYAKAIFKLKE